VRIATLANAAVIHTRRWVSRFRDRGHEVRVFSLEAPAQGFDAIRLPSAPVPGFARYPLAVLPLRRALARYRPDLVDAHYVPNYGMLAALAGVRPLSVTAWGSDLLVAGPSNALQRARARFVLRSAGLVLADSDNLAAAARALGAVPERTHAIPWGVELERFEGLPPREPGLLFSARMHEPIYDLATILRGVAGWLAATPHGRLVLAGDGSERAGLERLAREILPQGRVSFIGMVAAPELARWLGRAEFYLSASRSDSTSVTLLEAMAAGAIPVVTDIDGNREWVAEGAGARLFPPGDPSSLARALERALGDREWLAGARRRNLRVVAERGSWARNMARIEELFERLARGGV